MACASKPGERAVLPRQHLEGDRAREILRRLPLPPRQDVGLRRRGRLGGGRVQRRVRGRRGAGQGRRGGPAQAEAPRPHSQPRVPDRRRREGRDVRPALQLRPLPQPEGARPELHRLLRHHQDRPPAPGRPAEQVLPALLGLVPEPEVPLLPLRLVLERLPGRSRPGRGRGQPQLHGQPAPEHRRRHHQPPRRAQHGRPVPLLAGRGRPPDRGRVLPAARTPAACGSRAS